VPEKTDICVLISAGAEWRALLPHYPSVVVVNTPYGESFCDRIVGKNVCFLHGGCGKVAAAGSTQYAINRWDPQRIINIGTCGGFLGHIERGDVILAQKTIIYDIFEQMSDPDQAIEKFTIDFDLSWLHPTTPQPVRVDTLLSADRDLNPDDISWLIEKYDGVAADWESGAIAWVARRNNVPCLILRAVSDLVGTYTSDAYGDYPFFERQCQGIMANFALHLPGWIKVFQNDRGLGTEDS